MFKVISVTIMCVLSVYGALKLAFYLYGFFLNLNDREKIIRHTVIFLKDNQEEAEVSLREMVLGRNPFCGDIIAVDMGSEDETMSILRRLEREYAILRVMSIDEYMLYIRK